jgi:hypothetical protein
LKVYPREIFLKVGFSFVSINASLAVFAPAVYRLISVCL